ncbi:MAG: hypothetical protein ACM3ML_29790 [Micromonosporaceae bacterium]
MAAGTWADELPGEAVLVLVLLPLLPHAPARNAIDRDTTPVASSALRLV